MPRPTSARAQNESFYGKKPTPAKIVSPAEQERGWLAAGHFGRPVWVQVPGAKRENGLTPFKCQCSPECEQVKWLPVYGV